MTKLPRVDNGGRVMATRGSRNKLTNLTAISQFATQQSICSTGKFFARRSATPREVAPRLEKRNLLIACASRQTPGSHHAIFLLLGLGNRRSAHFEPCIAAGHYAVRRLDISQHQHARAAVGYCWSIHSRQGQPTNKFALPAGTGQARHPTGSPVKPLRTPCSLPAGIPHAVRATIDPHQAACFCSAFASL
jgi:hypothetical protein